MLLSTVVIATTALAGPHAEQKAQFGRRHAAPAEPHVAPPPAPSWSGPEITVYGYHPYWEDDPTALDFSKLTDLAIFDVELQADGSLANTDHWTDVAPAVIDVAHTYGVSVHLCVTAFDRAIINSVLATASTRTRAIDNLVELVNWAGADGVNVDFEDLIYAYKDEMVDFTAELSARVNEVYLATPAVDWEGSWDYDALANASDGLFIMGYGYHWSGGDPGPVDPLYGGGDWGVHSLEWSVGDYQTWGTPADKIILGLPLYGYEWPANHAIPGTALGDGTAMVLEDAVPKAEGEGALFDASSATPYSLPSGTQLWYGDIDSVAERIAWAVDADIQGIGFWALGYEGNNPEFWAMVAEETGNEFTGGGTGPSDTGNADTGDAEQPTDTGSTPDDTDDESQRPVADAGEIVIAYPGDWVMLDGSDSTDPNGETLTFVWGQVSGPVVELENAGEAQAHFRAKEVGAHTFNLVVMNSATTSEPSEVDVLVIEENKADEPAGCGCASQHRHASSWLALLGLVFGLRRRRP